MMIDVKKYPEHAAIEEFLRDKEVWEQDGYMLSPYQLNALAREFLAINQPDTSPKEA